MHKSGFLTLIVMFIVLTAPITGFASYQSGRHLRQTVIDTDYSGDDGLLAWKFEDIQRERGRFFAVPIDYERPELGTTDVYFFFEQSFDPAKPTTVVFDGGPGGSSHNGNDPKLSKLANILRFDARGVAFSRPESEELQRNPDFYSSTNTARDALKILDHLGIPDFSVLGVSAGAIPAFELARLAPSRTKSIILHSPSNPGRNSIEKTNFLLPIIWQVVSQTSDHWRFLDAAAKWSDMGEAWLESFVYYRVRRYGRKLGLKSAVDHILQLSERWRKGILLSQVLEDDPEKYYHQGREELFSNALFFDNVAFAILTKKEMGLRFRSIRWTASNIWVVFEEGTTVPEYEEELALVKSGRNDVYSRPSRVVPPVYVLSGSEDINTPPQSVRDVFNQIRADAKTLVTVVDGGHCFDTSNVQCRFQWQTRLKTRASDELWSKMINGQSVSVMIPYSYNLVGNQKMKIETGGSVLERCGAVLKGALW